jgi:predicted phage baseplate assembly protein
VTAVPLPAPNLDDRRFQDFVDDAKRLVQRRIPAWTDHNVHDPGITLIEAVATIADQLSYRLNQVPERHYRKLLDLLGITLMPPSAARAELTFRLSAPRPEPVRVPAGTRVATRRVPGTEPVSFTTLADLDVVPVSRAELHAAPAIDDGHSELRDLAPALAAGEAAPCFSPVPKPGDALYVGLSQPAPSCLILLRTDSAIEGIGVDPDHPPLRWEARTPDGWATCDVEQDTTGGLNRPGDIVVCLPHNHTAILLNGLRAGWIRAVVTEPEDGTPAYSRSPTVSRLSAESVGGRTDAVHADLITADALGQAEGVAGQRFALRRRPLLRTAQPLVLEVSDGAGWEEWTCVPDFASSGRDDPHFTVDRAAGAVELGPVVRLADGTVRNYGKVPAEGAMVRMREYWAGGGSTGNVPAGTLVVLSTPIPYIKSVSNRRPAVGGKDGESVEQAKVRAPLALRVRDRAVTAEDCEVIAAEAADGAALIRCVPPADPGDPVRVLVVPDIAGYGTGRFPFDALKPDENLLRRIAEALEARRVLGARILVAPPHYQGVTIAARLRARRSASPDQVREESVAALYRWLHPWYGGPDRAGWPFGRPVSLGDVHAALADVQGLDYIEDARLYPADPVAAVRGEAAQRIEIGADQLPFSYDHQVQVRA